MVIASAEASSNLARYDSTRYGSHVLLQRNAIARSPGEVYAHSRMVGFGAEVKRRVLLDLVHTPSRLSIVCFSRSLLPHMAPLGARLNFLQA